LWRRLLPLLLCLPLLLLLRRPLLQLLLLLLCRLPLVVWLLRRRLLVVVLLLLLLLLLLGLHGRLRRRPLRWRRHASRWFVVPTVAAGLLLLLGWVPLLLLLGWVPLLLLLGWVHLLLLLGWVPLLLLLRRVSLLLHWLLWCTLRQHYLAIPGPPSVVTAVGARPWLLWIRRSALVVERPLLLLLLLWVGLQGGTAALRSAWRAAFTAVGIVAAVAAGVAAATGAERPTARVWLLGLLLGAQAVGRLRVARLLLAVAPARFAALHAQFEVGQGRFAAPQGLSLQETPTACC